MDKPVLEPGSDKQWMFAVGGHVKNQGQHYALMVRLDGLAGVLGPFDNWDEAAAEIKRMSDEVSRLDPFSSVGEYSEINGVTKMNIRHNFS